ncbi:MULTISPECIES: VENN motif pre-toxin domain-containing protein [unclassified Gilliamella]|uniref:VENN motif pre-toxin domain-containing protein n=2 Tax=unclassified Gilliamella TaxID=2685620 RepID=UPI00226A993B|nr:MULTISPECIES: VENN motif pre-toxin domain-containing protein [unclassified Gilliamella]MCX8600765.1 VENN motif pre-toxin domain-containing protein [Gilliamella sp. B3722]MCX8609985.1 VENN motif pre-toxin domain-containing protein [Gilliamella sp. B3891]MCX8611925.1 VENN motif pre-toxin domain-containing protein [Gilliamella sp. B3773]MCX8619690.1 VENN motif pre-toxin domain-containing protein [Gilliamella sp. B3892]MCX8622135.1 VENN motif pre-toxin domain-containing protein [Gilliamella sp.
MSANGSLSATEMESKWASVTDQSGIFAGQGGYDITVGNNTDLKGAVIASKAEDTNKNKLDTGTISFSDIKNKADFKVTHVAISGGTAGPGAPTAFKDSDSDSSTTKSAVEKGELIIRNQDQQKQDINGLSRDTDSANNPLKQIFDKQKELDKIETVELIKDIAQQAKSVVKKYDRIEAQKEVDKNKDALTRAEAEKRYKHLSDEEKAKYASFEQYYSANEDSIYYALVDAQLKANKDKNLGTMGGNVSKGIDTAMAIVTGVITGDITGSLAGASAPWIAEQIKLHTGHADEKGNWVTDDIAGNLIAHAILGAVVAELQGGPSIAGGVGAVAGELAAKLIREQLYGKDVKDLTEAEKQNISALAQLAAGLAIAAGGGDTGAAGAAIAAGKNAVENNALNRQDSWDKKILERKLSFKEMTDEERAYYLDKVKQFKELDEKDDKAFLDACAGSGNNTTAACGAQLAKLRAFKEEYEMYFGRYPYSEYLQDDYKKIVRYLESYTPDKWTYAINNYAKENNISYEEAASKLEPAMYAEKFAEIVSLYYGVKGVGVVKGKISAADLAKVDAAINEYNALKQNINKNNWKYAEGEYSQKPTETINVESPNQISYGDKGAGKGTNATQIIIDKNKFVTPDLPGVAQSRVNVANVTYDNGKIRGFEYAMGKHGADSSVPNKSRFLIGTDEVKTLLQRPDIVNKPVYNPIQIGGKVETNKFVRQVDVGKPIGFDQSGNKTSVITIITDRKGNLINTFPGKL